MIWISFSLIYWLACFACLKGNVSTTDSLVYAFVTARIFYNLLYSKFSLKLLQYSVYLALASNGELAAAAIASAACYYNFLVFGI
jgi:hypothetical protein